MKKYLIFGSIPIVIVVAALVILFLRSKDDESLVFTGMIETKTVNAASLLPGRVDTLLVEPGDKVHRGQLLALMNDHILEAKVGQAEGMVKTAESTSSLIKKGMREEQKQTAKSQLNIAENEFRFAEKTYKRYETLYTDSIISDQEFEAIRLRYEAAKDQLEISKNIYKIAISGSRKDEVGAAEGQYQTAYGVYKEAEAFRNELFIYSPVEGEIADQIAEEGEVVGPGYPIFTIIIPAKNYALLQVREDYMNYFKKGTKYQLMFPALNNEKYEFQVHYIAPMADFANWEPTDLKGSFDLKTFEVHLKPNTPIKDLRPGMTFRLEIMEPQQEK
jgi:HlyD family secretion protein